jgi:hypothetical protein
MVPRILQERFEKRQQEDRRDRANARECNLNHVEVISTKQAKLHFGAAGRFQSLDLVKRRNIVVRR